MMIATTLASALNYLFCILMTRLLGDEGAFASFNSLNSVLLISSMGIASVQTVVAKHVSGFEAVNARERTKALVASFTRAVLVAGMVILVVSALLAPAVGRMLKLDSNIYLVVVGVSLASALFLTLPNGVLQGEQRFLALGAFQLATAAFRIVAGVLLVLAGLDVYGALGATAVANILVAGIMVYMLKRLFLGKAVMPDGFRPSRAFVSVLPVMIGISIVVFMSQIDVVLVKALFSDLVADRYSYGALAGKAVLFFPAGITMVMFPRVSASRVNGEPTLNALMYSLGVCLLLEAMVVGFFALFPSFTATVFAGEHSGELNSITGAFGIRLVVLFGIVMAVYALLNLLVYYHLACDRVLFLAVMAAGAVAEVVGILLFHNSLTDVLYVMFVIGAALLLFNLLYAVLDRQPAPALAAVDISPAGSQEN